jgi:citrate synthase
VAKELNRTTSICGYDADNIMVRGKNLVTELMGKVSFPEMILLQMLGKTPTPAQVEILNAVMVTIMEHGLVPSAIAARLTIYGAPESYQGAIAAGLLGVGDRFAGTASACAKMLEPLVAVPEAEREAACRASLREYKAAKRPVPGFGHPIHRDGDPRYARLMDITRNAGTSGVYLKTLELLESCIEEEIGRPLVTNISAAIGAALGEAGLPAKAMRGIVLTARCAGLAGHLLEESERPIGEAMWNGVEEAISYDPEG